MCDRGSVAEAKPRMGIRPHRRRESNQFLACLKSQSFAQLPDTKWYVMESQLFGGAISAVAAVAAATTVMSVPVTTMDRRSDLLMDGSFSPAADLKSHTAPVSVASAHTVVRAGRFNSAPRLNSSVEKTVIKPQINAEPKNASR